MINAHHPNTWPPPQPPTVRTILQLHHTADITDTGYQHALTAHRITWAQLEHEATRQRTTRMRHAKRAATPRQQHDTITHYAAAIATNDATTIMQALDLLQLAGIDYEKELTQ